MAYKDAIQPLTLVLDGPKVVYLPTSLTGDPGSYPIKIYPYMGDITPGLSRMLARWSAGLEFYIVQLTEGVPPEKPYSPVEEAERYFATAYGLTPADLLYAVLSPANGHITYSWADFYVAAWSSPGLKGMRLEIALNLTGG